MSNRCLITFKKNITKEDEVFDCIYTEDSNPLNLLEDWIGYTPGSSYIFGPWKLSIRDKELFPNFYKDYCLFKDGVPPLDSLDKLWSIDIDGQIIHVTEPDEIKELIKLLNNEQAK